MATATSSKAMTMAEDEKSKKLETARLPNDPMENDLILENIFRFCDFRSLKKIRLVSSRWRDLSLKAWRDKAVLQLSFKASSRKKLEFGKFLDLMEHKTLKFRKRAFKNYTVEFDGTYPRDQAYWKEKRVAFANWKSQAERICMMKAVTFPNGLDCATFFLRRMKVPLLEKLIVENEKKQNPDWSARGARLTVWAHQGQIYDRLETFELHDNMIVPPPEMIEIFRRMMPNLVRLTIPVDKYTFTLICQHFKGLKLLHVLSGQMDHEDLDDEALTGISKAQLDLEEGGVPSRRPNITDLEHLSDLKICCQKQLQCNNVKFTEHSVIHGFLQLPQLHYLSVAIKEMSDQVKDKLLEHVKGNVHFQKSERFQLRIILVSNSSVAEDGENKNSDPKVE